MKLENLEQEVLYDKHSPKSGKRLALSVLLLKESIDTETISRVAGVSERQIRNYRKTTYEEQGNAVFTSDTRYRPVGNLEAYRDLIREDLTGYEEPPYPPVPRSGERCTSRCRRIRPGRFSRTVPLSAWQPLS